MLVHEFLSNSGARFPKKIPPPMEGMAVSAHSSERAALPYALVSNLKVSVEGDFCFIRRNDDIINAMKDMRLAYAGKAQK
jgi:hypothetical protein